MNKILGREPVLFYTLVSAVILLASSFVHLTVEMQGALNGAVMAGGALFLALKVSAEKAVAGLSYAVKAVVALYLAFGGHIDPVVQNEIMLAVTAGVAFWLHGKVVAPIDAYGNEVPTSIEDPYPPVEYGGVEDHH